MTSTEEHKNKIREHLEAIDEAIKSGIERKPITIGFHCSACALQLLELYLHAANKITPGKILKHDWFKRPAKEQKREPLIERMLKVEFPKKTEVYNLIYSLEEERNSLLYGKNTESQIKEVIVNFTQLKEIFAELLKDEGTSL